MKKIGVLILVVIIIIMAATIVVLLNKLNNSTISTVAPVEFVDESGDEILDKIQKLSSSNNTRYDADKKFIYLINNEIFATRVGDKWYSSEESKVTLNDLFSSEAFYPFEGKQSPIKKITINKILYGDDSRFEEDFEKVNSLLDQTKLINITSGDFYSLGGGLDALNYNYKIPFETSGEDVTKLLGVYNNIIEVTHGGLHSNDAKLQMIEPKVDNYQYLEVKEYLDKNYSKYLNELDVKGYWINIDEDDTTEKVYIISTPFNYPVIDSDKIAFILIVDDDEIITEKICEANFRSKNDSEFWDNYKYAWHNDIDIKFADFDHDGKVEFLIESELLDLESRNCHRLYKLNGNKLELLTEYYGPNE